MLSRWARSVAFPCEKEDYIYHLESRTAEIPLEDPWIIAERLYSPAILADGVQQSIGT